MTEIGFLILGIAAGILSGLFGIGGGIVMVPSLIVIFGMDILDANATSLAAMLLPVGILGVIAYYKAGLINIKDSLWISGGLFLGSFGASIASLRVIFQLFQESRPPKYLSVYHTGGGLPLAEGYNSLAVNSSHVAKQLR